MAELLFAWQVSPPERLFRSGRGLVNRDRAPSTNRLHQAGTQPVR